MKVQTLGPLMTVSAPYTCNGTGLRRHNNPEAPAVVKE